MVEFFNFLKVFMVCGTVFFIVMLVLLALPQSKLRLVGLEMGKWVLCAALVVMVPSPIDALPDAIPVLGWLDDIAYIVGAIAAARGALGERRKRAMLEEIEMNALRAQAED
jgi:uncharacterized membrane protein YkvA (DUF1232 family)